MLGIRNADAGARADLSNNGAVVKDFYPFSQRQAIQRLIDPKSGTQFSRSAAQAFQLFRSPPLLHRNYSRQRLNRTDQHCSSFIFFRREIQAPVHPVDQVHVDVGKRIKHQRAAFRPLIRMRGRISAVRFRFHNPAGAAVDGDDFTEQFPSHGNRIAGKKC